MPEHALEPDLPICDPHHHLYLPGSPFHDGAYGLDDLARDVSGHRVLQTVYVETQTAYRPPGSSPHLAPVGETDWVAGLLSPGGLVRGVVAFADLMLPDRRLREVLDAHRDAAGDRLKGIRFRASNAQQPLPPADWLTCPQMIVGATELGRRGLVLDLHVMYDELAAVATLARSVPATTIVVDHMGAPVIPSRSRHRHREAGRDDVLTVWRRGIAELARIDNVTIKIGGIGSYVTTDPAELRGPVTSEVIAGHWGADLRFAIDSFGPERSMIEGNFPIDGYLCEYTMLWNAYKRMTRVFGPAERRRLFHDTAAEVYGLARVRELLDGTVEGVGSGG
ncbi:amidohydrolase [Pseudonocardia sulfidoxydans NBRC 16205]|uniref:Amidohydrolase n=1 Tax=Pseudonocardia sulfidoxydans NBRC 16205 TaxID=1223511 RepID=A0A511DC31_9PSEU|nr:amidohydrolase family protein [Pseudonocardia sulfidoxydans]GEL21224.1 amidohydrolase [Pseudonocardia sulfidoxydans NBRC 16205]